MYYKDDQDLNVCAVCDKSILPHDSIVACTSYRGMRDEPGYPLAYCFHGDCAPAKPVTERERMRFDADWYVSMMRHVHKMGPAKLEWCK